MRAALITGRAFVSSQLGASQSRRRIRTDPLMPQTLVRCCDPRRIMRAAFIIGIVLVAIVVGIAEIFNSGASAQQWAAEMTGGSPQHGRDVIPYYACSTCHTIPGIRPARGIVGPPLEGVADRLYFADALPTNAAKRIH